MTRGSSSPPSSLPVLPAKASLPFSSEIQAVTGISRLRYILYDRWPEDGNGFLKDILDTIKK